MWATLAAWPAARAAATAAGSPTSRAAACARAASADRPDAQLATGEGAQAVDGLARARVRRRPRGRVLLAAAAVVAVAIGTAGVGRSLGWFGASAVGCERGGPHQEVQPPSAGDAPEVDLPAAAVRPIATGLCAPWGLAFLPDGTALVTERDTARTLSVTAAGRVSEVQRLTEVRPRGEGGLLGIARLHLGEAPQPILTGIPAGDFHAGGRIAFGPEGMLYAAVGETWVAREIAQDRGSLGGKILRVTPEGRPAPGNPFPGSPVWSLGHRNPRAWRGTPAAACTPASSARAASTSST